MKNILNKIFYILRYFLLIMSFSITLYIVLFMYKRVSRNIVDSVDIFFPYLLICILFVLNSLLKQKNVNKCLFYNLTCCFSFVITIIVGYRSLFDKNMVMNEIMGYDINFFFFNDYIPFMKLMLYGLCLSNILLMLGKIKDTKEIEVEVL